MNLLIAIGLIIIVTILFTIPTEQLGLFWRQNMELLGGKVQKNSNYSDLWENFKLEYEKCYERKSEEERRMKIFYQNLEKIKEHNKGYDQGSVTYKLGINYFADMISDEFFDYVNYNITDQPRLKRLKSSRIWKSTVPDSIDWRKRGLVTRVKKQSGCGACWAFAAVGALEGQYKRKTGKLIDLSLQNLIDCSGMYGTDGCIGGSVTQAFNYAKAKGIESETDYPYVSEYGRCKFDSSKSLLRVKRFSRVPRGEEHLKTVVGTLGPVVVHMHIKNSLRLYDSGYYDDPLCMNSNKNHALLVVGYGKEGGKDYWILKNSWGRYWGERGYFKLLRNKNRCGIADFAVYPILK